MTEDPINNQIKQSLDTQVESLDMNTQVKLNELRHAAINHPSKRSFKLLKWSLAGTVAATVMIISLILVQPNQQPPQSNDTFMFEDLELLANEADTDFYQDLEFLNWLNESEWAETGI